jgi:hypothetical protein
MKKSILVLLIAFLFCSCSRKLYSSTENDITINGAKSERLHVETVSVKRVVQPKKLSGS